MPSVGDTQAPMGTLLFALAVSAIIIAPIVGLVWGSGRTILYRWQGRDLSAPVDHAKAPVTAHATVDVNAPSVLNERHKKGGAPDPFVCIDGTDYRVTRIEPSRYLVTERRESRRLGFFELVADADRAEVVPEPDDPNNGFLLVRIAVAAGRSKG
jgi:hypothetical protein